MHPLQADGPLQQASIQTRASSSLCHQPFEAAYERSRRWLQASVALEPATTCILAARNAASLLALSPPSSAIPLEAADLLTTEPEDAALRAAAGVFGRGLRLSSRDMDMIRHGWRLAACTEALIVSGGDDRLTLDRGSGLNRYGCAPRPRPDVIGFSSCTASSLSESAYAAVVHAHGALLEAALQDGHEPAMATSSQTTTARVLEAFGATHLAQAILTASGTDAALVVTGLLLAEQPIGEMTSILMSPAETGTGIPYAVQACHFAGIAASGAVVAKGEPVGGLPSRPRLVTVALRSHGGEPLPAGDIERTCSAAIEAALPYGRVVLHAIDGSKTGLTAPGQAALVRLANRFGARLDIVIDACQARVEPALVQWYLAQGFPVLVTGSKFYAAPGFCGAILFPRARFERLAGRIKLPADLLSYAHQDDIVGSRRCPGLLLRWAAALHEMACFGALEEQEVVRRLGRLGDAVCTALAQNPRLSLVAAPRPAGNSWSSRRSVFTFKIADEGGWMETGRLRDLYLALQDDVSDRHKADSLSAILCQIGQPVQLGATAIGGLRIAVSATQVTSCADLRNDLATVMGKLTIVLRPSARALPYFVKTVEPAE